MQEQAGDGPEAKEVAGREGRATDRDQPECVMEGAGQTELRRGQEEPGRGMQQRWEAQWQHFLQTLQSNDATWGSPPVSDPRPWDDAKAFLASFEQVAAACRWPRGEWVARLLPALSGEARQAFMHLEARDKEDYGKVKAAILRDEALRREKQRQHFRHFSCQELEDPRKLYVQIQALCCQWLKPERHTKEQILELLVLEQFLASLPVEAQSWIQAGGPDSCAQAVALLEDFLIQREAETETWQEQQELTVVLLDTKEECLDPEQGETPKESSEIFNNTMQNVDGEIAVPGTGLAHPTSLLLPEGQDMNEAELTKAVGISVDQVMNRRKGLPLHMVEQTPMQSTQRTTFWKVLQEDGENMDSLEGSLGLQLGLALHPVKKDEMFVVDPVESRVRGWDSVDRKENQFEVKNAQVGGNEPVETPRTGQQKTQENVLVRDAVMDERWESNGRPEIEPLTSCKESAELREDFGAACSYLSPVATEGRKALFSKYGRRYRPKLDKDQNSQMEMKNYECLEFEVGFPFNSSAKDHITHTIEKTYGCAECGKMFTRRSTLLRHRNIHTGEKPQKCMDCGKRFSQRSHMLTHQMIHAEQKSYLCPEGGENFSLGSNFLTYQMMHAGEKPHKCPGCGKSFNHRSNLLGHVLIHAQSPHVCAECGKSFSQRSSLLTHQIVHKGEKPHKCNECGKGFCQKYHLLRHEMIHTGKKPHQCHNCGKRFSRRCHLLRHEVIHTKEKTSKSPEGGQSLSDIKFVNPSA